MLLTLKQTDVTGSLNNTMCSVWEGTSAGGVKVVAFIALVAVSSHGDHVIFEQELSDVEPASPAVIRVLDLLSQGELDPVPDPDDNAVPWPTRES